MPNKQFDIIRHALITQLQKLDTRLSYHNIEHTLDVLFHAERIAREENIHHKREIYLLKLAALYHDAGFLHIYTGHEEESCRIFEKDASTFELSEKEISFVKQLIMATKVNYEPVGLFEKIIKDADLDYLGRPDFHVISKRLKDELLHYNMISGEKEWNERQMAFLQKHQYYTASAQQLRGPVKQHNYNSIR